MRDGWWILVGIGLLVWLFSVRKAGKSRPSSSPQQQPVTLGGETLSYEGRYLPRLTPTGLSYEEWLALLLRSRGCTYWLTLTTGPRSRDTWVEQGFARMATLFPDFAPDAMRPATPFEDVDTDGE